MVNVAKADIMKRRFVWLPPVPSSTATKDNRRLMLNVLQNCPSLNRTVLVTDPASQGFNKDKKTQWRHHIYTFCEHYAKSCPFPRSLPSFLTCQQKQPGGTGFRFSTAHPTTTVQRLLSLLLQQLAHCSNRGNALMYSSHWFYYKVLMLIYQSKVKKALGRAPIGCLWQDGRSDWLKNLC